MVRPRKRSLLFSSADAVVRAERRVVAEQIGATRADLHAREATRLCDRAQTGTGPPRKPPKRAIQSDELEASRSRSRRGRPAFRRAPSPTRRNVPVASTRGERLDGEHDDERRHERRERVVANEGVQIAGRKREHGARRAAPGTRHVEDAARSRTARAPSTSRKRERAASAAANDAARARRRACASLARMSLAQWSRVCVWHRRRPMRFSQPRFGRSPRP